MYRKQPDIPSLISSRICHDLVSPLGAITNGLELIELSGAASGEEYALLNDSVADATARINFFRIAFGPQGQGLSLSETQIRSVLDSLYSSGRLSVQWLVQNDVPRPQAKLALLLIQCCETFLPAGGTISAFRDGDSWTISAEDDRLRVDTDKLAHLLGSESRPEMAARDVQFVLARSILSEDQVEITANQDRTRRIELTYSYAVR